MECTKNVVFSPAEIREPFCDLGSKVCISDYDDSLWCQKGSSLKNFNFHSRRIQRSIEEDNDEILTFDVGPHFIATAHKSGLIRFWTMEGLPHSTSVLNSASKNPIIFLSLTKDRLVTLSSDRSLKVWTLTAKEPFFKGSYRGLSECPSVVLPTVLRVTEEHILVGTNDGKIFIWNYNQTIKPERICHVHMSAITSIVLLSDETFISSSRDDTLVKTSIRDGGVILTRAVLSHLSAGLLLSHDGQYLYGGGGQGPLRLFSTTLQDLTLDKFPPFSNLTLLTKGSHYYYALQDGIISRWSQDSDLMESVETNIYEVSDCIFVSNRYLVSSYGTTFILVIDNTTSSRKFLSGHSESVISLASCNGESKVGLFASGSKDKTVILWQISPCFSIRSLAVLKGHSSAVTGLCLSNSFLISGSKDSVIKVWNIEDENNVVSRRTVLGHDKGEINSLDLSPDTKYLASGSQDKSIKIWDSTNLTCLSKLTGHRRGIWSVKFSSFDKLLVSASADATLKIWELNHFSCLHTLEGHEASVLKANFINRQNLASVSSDGLLKIWSAASGNCLGSFDHHDHQIWSLVIIDEKTLYTGDANGKIIKWIDDTENVKKENNEKNAKSILMEQSLDNYFQKGKLIKALKISLHSDKPRKALSALMGLQSRNEIPLALSKLSEEETRALIEFVSKWNCFGQHSQLAQGTLNALLRANMSFISGKDVNEKSLSSLLAYTKKHQERLHLLHKRISVLDLLIKKMSF